MKYAFSLLATLALLCSPAGASDLSTGKGRLLATGGVTTIDGTAGGGIVPMAVLAGYGTASQHGGVVSGSRLDTGDFSLTTYAAAWSWHNRVELSVSRQALAIGAFADAVPALSLEQLRTNNYGVKLRLYGDVLYSRWPQLSLGATYRESINPGVTALGNVTVPQALGARSDYGTDVYAAATKVFLGGPLGRNWLLNGVVRAGKGNQAGLVGQGGDRDGGTSLLAEASAGVFLNKHWLLGAEYRQQPDNLTALHQDDWYDLFVAWFPNKQWSLTTAWVNLGEVSSVAVPYRNDDRDQSGVYLSLTGAF